MRIPLLLLSFLSSLVEANTEKQESALPPYLQGIGWENVEAELRKDLRLSSIRPIHYDLNLNVSVSGYGETQKSTFDGNVVITLNTIAPVKDVEVHSLGLSIGDVKLSVYRHEKWNSLNGGKFHINEERETIVIPSRRLILPEEQVTLMITYNGTARMNGRGFYESWNPRELEPRSLPYISLVTNCIPTSARRWFPCFDEPDKKATFQLSVAHPAKTTAYSNTPIISTSTDNITQLTHFAQTVPLPTYLVALAVTAQPVSYLNVNGYQFGAIGFKREEAVQAVAQSYFKLQNYSIFDGIPFIAEKTDILVVYDFSFGGAVENPGLITFNKDRAANLSTHIHELAHMYFGNLVTLSTWGDIWVNEAFGQLFASDLVPASNVSEIISLYDLPIHSETTYTSSIHIESYFFANEHIHYARAGQFLRMVRKFMGADIFDRSIKNYLLDNAYGNGDATKIIKYLLNEYEGYTQLERILYEWIYQPGVAIIFVERNGNQLEIRQQRLHSSYFDGKLRDENTRFTIPLFCKMNGKQRTFVLDSRKPLFILPLSVNSTFEIEDDYGQLFGVWSPPDKIPDVMDLETRTKITRFLDLSKNLVLTGLLDIEKFSTVIAPFIGNSLVREYLENIITPEQHVIEDIWVIREKQCIEREEKFERILFNEPLEDIFDQYLIELEVDVLFCSVETRDKQEMKSLLRKMLITAELKIMNSQLAKVIGEIEKYHPGATMEFLMEELEKNPSSLELRPKIVVIVEAVFGSIKQDISTLREFIRLYPSIITENYEVIQKVLEKKHIVEGMKKKELEFEDAIREILEKKEA